MRSFTRPKVCEFHQITASSVRAHFSATFRLMLPLVILVAQGMAAQAPTFTKSDYSTGFSPTSLAIADYNLDGNVDLAIANQNNISNSSVSIFLGRGDGTFQSPTTYSTGNNPQTIAAGDFNGDGIPDLVTANQSSGDISVLIGNGDGSFQAARNSAVGFNPQYLAAADLNGDGKMDIVVSLHDSGVVIVLLGNGDGSFQPGLACGVGAHPYGIAVSDFDGDHIQDLAVVNTTDRTVSVLHGNGDGTFQSAVDYPVSGAAFLADIAANDFNGDGNLDLAITNTNCDPNLCSLTAHSVSVLLGAGDGTFGVAANYGVDLSPYFLTTSDVNADGKADIITANQGANDITVLYGNGDGTFSSAVNYPVGTAPFMPRAADFNHDGRVDLAVVNAASNTVSVLVQSPPAFVAQVLQPINSDGSSIFNASKGVVPVKFMLTRNNVATCTLPAATIGITRTAGGTIGAIDESVYTMPADSGSYYRIDSCAYIYNVSSKALGVGTYRVDILLNGQPVGNGVFALK